MLSVHAVELSDPRQQACPVPLLTEALPSSEFINSYSTGITNKISNPFSAVQATEICFLLLTSHALHIYNLEKNGSPSYMSAFNLIQSLSLCKVVFSSANILAAFFSFSSFSSKYRMPSVCN
uniref:Uncharacterized protein n=1 Tax=Sphaerodactylus townsendi TaxID=933632 RepID=A0ACB8FQ02_9SAUR